MPKYCFPSCFLLFVTIISALILSNPITYAVDYSDDVSKIDNVSIGVPVSCNLTGTNTDHTATISNGTYQSDIGTTTLNVSCNDAEGFAIYAIGYTDETEGKNVLTSPVVGSTYDIATGTATSGNTSNWAVKLATNSNATYPVTIENNFNNYHNIPDDYTLVAKRLSGTDIGASATGSTLTTTYQAYVAATQPSGSYQGKVKYVLVHPNTDPAPVHENQIGVLFDGNGLTFPGGATTNRVIYEEVCEDEYGYIADEPAGIVRTSNLSDDGTQNGSYSRGYDMWMGGQNGSSFDGVTKVKVEVYYKIDANTVFIDYSASPNVHISCESGVEVCEGSMSYISNSDHVSFYYDASGSAVSGYDYGAYVQIYPVYDEPTAGASYGFTQNVCSYQPVSGTYVETTTWDYWYNMEDGWMFWSEENIIDYLKEHEEDLKSTTLRIYSYNPYRIIYNGNKATAGTMDGFATTVDTPTAATTLMAPNFKRDGYGFAGWSTRQNTTINSGEEIYGPNETITGDKFTFDPTTREATLYAVWVPSSGTMQGWSGCASMNIGQVIALTDIRDNNVYTVAKLANNKCWMTENLRLDSVNSSDGTKAQGFGGAFVGLADSETNMPSSGTPPANSLYNSSNITGSNLLYRYPRYNNNNTRINDTSLTANPGQNLGGNNGNIYKWYSYGNYYTWAAAMANTDDLTNSDTGTSICPTGWILPTQSMTFTLTSDLSATIIRKYPNNFIFSGRWTSSGGTSRGSAGYYWTSTIYNNTQAYNMYIGSSSALGASHSTRNTAYAIRCVSNI